MENKKVKGLVYIVLMHMGLIFISIQVLFFLAFFLLVSTQGDPAKINIILFCIMIVAIFCSARFISHRYVTNQVTKAILASTLAYLVLFNFVTQTGTSGFRPYFLVSVVIFYFITRYFFNKIKV